MRVRLTPLNILMAVLVTAVGYYIIFPDEEGWRLLGAVTVFMLAVMCFLSDLLFRFLLKDLKRIWIVEVCFIIFAVVLIIIIKR